MTTSERRVRSPSTRNGSPGSETSGRWFLASISGRLDPQRTVSPSSGTSRWSMRSGPRTERRTALVPSGHSIV
jgi:hypothetical protein